MLTSYQLNQILRRVGDVRRELETDATDREAALLAKCTEELARRVWFVYRQRGGKCLDPITGEVDEEREQLMQRVEQCRRERKGLKA